MKLVVDTNVLFTFFWKNSVGRDLLLDSHLTSLSPLFALTEVDKYKKEIIRKARLDEGTYESELAELKIAVSFIALKEYSSSLSILAKHCPDSNDIDFLSLAHALKLPLWSNDERLKEQDVVIVLNTKEVIGILAEEKEVRS